MQKVTPFLIIVVAFGIAAAMIKFKAEPSARPAPAPVVPSAFVIQAQPVTARPRVSSYGTVAAEYRIPMTAEVNGQITEVGEQYRLGGRFSAGDVLLTIDTTPYRSAVAKAEADLASARQTLATERGAARQARREWRDLGEEEANALFLRKPQVAAAEAQVAAARAALTRARYDLDKTSVRAPFDGHIVDISATLGQFISTGSALATIYSAERFRFAVPLTDEQLALLPGAPVPGTTFSEALPVTILADIGRRLRRVPALLTGIDANVDMASRTYGGIVEATRAISGPLIASLAPGMFVDVEIIGQELSDVQTLPLSALFERDKVFVARDGIAEVVDVDVLQHTGDSILISGLQTGDVVIVDRPLTVQPGKPVRVAPLPDDQRTDTP
ncbi:MAG: efflux RND transporter periplasmic adaptor subunit [Gammaproteobacteria bacterium]|nr:efflux RND transporter periplasmic adaptor subunit [Gammaproteobacteria bacterium]NNL99854.1 efflux RND transporter periplasmic adaptor subunit [Gammaproteobacteria bacterium]